MTSVPTGTGVHRERVGQDVTESIPSGSLVEQLRALHEDYVDAVHRAVAEDRDDLVEELAREYPDAAAALISRLLPAAA